MKSYRKELWFIIPSRRGFVNITGQVSESLHESGIHEGLNLVNAMHMTASVFIIVSGPLVAILLIISVVFAAFYPLSRERQHRIRRSLFRRRSKDRG